MVMNKLAVYLVFISFFLLIYSCNKNVTPVIIEEHDPVIKIIEEKDSIRIIHNDSNKIKQNDRE